MYEFLPLLLALAFVAYCLAYRKLQMAVQPFRLKIAENGEWLIAQESLNGAAKSYVESMLNGAFSARLKIIFGIVLSPILAVVTVVNPKALDEITLQFDPKSYEQKVRLEETIKLSRIVTFANHPFLAAILFIELSILIPIADLAFAVFRGVIPKAAGLVWMVLAERQRTRFLHA